MHLRRSQWPGFYAFFYLKYGIRKRFSNSCRCHKHFNKTAHHRNLSFATMTNGFEPSEVYEALKIGDYEIQDFIAVQGDENERLDEMLCCREATEEAGEDDAEAEAEHYDTDDILSESLKQATSNERSLLRRKLSKFFGSDADLLWALRACKVFVNGFSVFRS
jgi:hypothetical protein